MSLKGFSASYMAVESTRQNESFNSKRQELVTPFPGSFKSVYAHAIDDDGYDAALYNRFEAFNVFQRNNKRGKKEWN